MARAIQRTARKEYPHYGIKKGDRYWFAEVKTGPRSSRTIRSLKPIPRSQLTASEFLSTAYDLSDQLETCDSLEQLIEIKEGFESLQDETQEKLDNMPEGLQQGDTGQLLQERIDQCESIISEIEDAANDIEAENSEGDENKSDEENNADDVRAAIEQHICSGF